MRRHRDRLRCELLRRRRRAPATFIFIIAPAMAIGRTFSNVSTDAYDNSPSAAPRAPGQCRCRLTRPPVSIVDGFCLGRVHIFQRVVQRLGFGDVGIGELLHDRRNLGKILQLQRDVCIHPISHQLSLRGLVVIDRLQRNVADLGRLGLDPIRSQESAAPAPRIWRHDRRLRARSLPARRY